LRESDKAVDDNRDGRTETPTPPAPTSVRRRSPDDSRHGDSASALSAARKGSLVWRAGPDETAPSDSATPPARQAANRQRSPQPLRHREADTRRLARWPRQRRPARRDQ